MSKHGFSLFGFSDVNFEKGQQEYKANVGSYGGGGGGVRVVDTLIINPYVPTSKTTLKCAMWSRKQQDWVDSSARRTEGRGETLIFRLLSRMKASKHAK